MSWDAIGAVGEIVGAGVAPYLTSFGKVFVPRPGGRLFMAMI